MAFKFNNISVISNSISLHPAYNVLVYNEHLLTRRFSFTQIIDDTGKTFGYNEHPTDNDFPHIRSLVSGNYCIGMSSLIFKTDHYVT